MAYENKGSMAVTVTVSCYPDVSGNFVCSAAEAHNVTIQRAIDHVEALYVGRDWKPKIVLKGNFHIQAQIILVSYLTLEIQGRMILGDNAGFHMIMIGDGGVNAFSDIDIIGGDWDGNRANQVALFNCIHMDQDVSRVRIMGCTFHGWYGRSIYSDGTGAHKNHYIIVVECYGYDYEPAVDSDFFDADNSTHVIVANNIAVGAGDDGIDLGAVEQFVIANNSCSDCNVGIEIASGAKGIIIGNTCFSNDTFGIAMTATKNTTVTGNFITYNTQHGLRLVSVSDDNVIVGNTFWRNNVGDTTYDEISVESSSYNVISSNNMAIDHPTLKADYGIDLDATSHYNTVTGNIISGGAEVDGIRVAGDYNQFKDNQVSDSAGYGITVSAGAIENTVKDNRFFGNVSGCINDGGTDTKTAFMYCRVTDPNDNLGTHPAVRLEDATDTDVYDQFYVPLEFQELVTANVVVVAATSGDMVWTVTTNWGKLCTTDAYNEDDDADNGTEGLLIDDLECVDISAAFTGIAAGDLVGVNFMRDGDDGGDTIGDVVYYLGIRVRYV